MSGPVYLHQLRPTVAVEKELEWFFNRAESDMGLRSNFLASLGRHGPGPQVPSPEDGVEAAHRWRHVRGWLAAIEATHAGVLRCAYELRDWPVALWGAYGRLTGIVVRLSCAHDVARGLAEERRAQAILETDHAAWLAAECHRAALDPAFARLRRDAQARLARAGAAYTRVRGNVLPLAGRRTR